MRKLKTEDPKPNVDEAKKVADQLMDAITTADKQSNVQSARAAVFQSSNAPKEQPMPTAMRKIVEMEMGDGETAESMIADKLMLEDELDSSNKVGHQVQQLERAELNARKAFRILIRYRQLHTAWERDNATVFSSIWYEASKALQREKDLGNRSKQITDKDVDMMCASMFPDEWRENEVKALRAKQTEKSLEHLVEMWTSKCRSLKSLVEKGR
jgi:hypothetical protein